MTRVIAKQKVRSAWEWTGVTRGPVSILLSILIMIVGWAAKRFEQAYDEQKIMNERTAAHARANELRIIKLEEDSAHNPKNIIREVMRELELNGSTIRTN